MGNHSTAGHDLRCEIACDNAVVATAGGSCGLKLPAASSPPAALVSCKVSAMPASLISNDVDEFPGIAPETCKPNGVQEWNRKRDDHDKKTLRFLMFFIEQSNEPVVPQSKSTDIVLWRVETMCRRSSMERLRQERFSCLILL